MPTVPLISVSLALCVALPISAATKEYRSTSVKHEFQLTHPCPSTGLTSGACPGWVKDHIVPLACGGPDGPSNMQSRRSGMRRRRINGRRRAVLGSVSPIGVLSRSLRNQPLSCRTRNLPAVRANREPKYPRCIEQPSPWGRPIACWLIIFSCDVYRAPDLLVSEADRT